jgi:hypothetical protein
MAADDRRAVGCILSGGQAHDAVEGRLLPDAIGRLRSSETDRPLFLLMDRTYEDLETRLFAFERGYSPVVPPKKTGNTRGSMTKRGINGAMRWNGCFGG